MTALEKARLEVLDRSGKVTESIPVQFNPSTMTLQMSNSNDGGGTRGRQTQQYNGSSSTTLSLDLEFDTADDGTTEQPVDVRTHTRKVAQFVLPGGEASKQAPPRVGFRWGTFELVGVMSSLTEELGLFSSGGVPLRAKVSVQIKEQDPKFDALERGPGANTDTGPPAAGEGGAAGPGGPGTSGGGIADTAAPALAGETPADFLARNGLAPAAWRALGSALGALADGIELEAGLSVEFAASLSVGVGVGVSAGFQAGLDASLGASLGLEGGGTGGAAGGAGLQQGFALASAGGLTAASETAKATAASDAAAAARASFGQAPRDAAPPPRGPAALGALRGPLAASVVGGLRPPPAAPAPLPPKADPRTTTFGLGVPLRDRVGVPGAEADGYVVIGATAPIDASTRSHRPGRSAPWEQLAPARRGAGAGPAHPGRTGRCVCRRCAPSGGGR